MLYSKPTLLCALLLTGCASIQAPYTAPVTQVPTQWQYASAATATHASPWWTRFNDPVLDQLVDQALLRNNNLAAATIKVRQAQLQAGLAENRPNFSGSLNTGASRALNGNASTARSSGASLGASYEVDLWNKLGSQRDVALWEARATEQDRAATALALVGTTAQLYWQLGYLNQRLVANLQSIATAEKTLQLVQAQASAGAVGGLELAEARQSLLNLQANHTTLQQQAVAANTALALLFDTALSSPPAQPQTLPTSVLPEVAAGLPAELLARRPDLRAAELRLRESHANITATRASYYPALTLTGALGTSSTSLLNLLSNPVASLGLGIGLPFLNQKEMDLNIQVAQAQNEAAVVNFRQTLYTALGDVDNALSARQQYRAQAVLLTQALQAATEAERLYAVRYRAGAVALKPWLDAQESRRSAEIALAGNRLNQFNNHATLVLALGGDAVLPE
ncbi:efflux transporter outer membrane subunit [Rhodoferax sp.]|uniref:efflux transporter outer membrane subunit n=1 Tax=Rhodoferax sp. TaxID=50421 RepID=UPI0025ED3375|nr:efflux transporter outer membrane subunit [Rhodoferax sp.]